MYNNRIKLEMIQVKQFHFENVLGKDSVKLTLKVSEQVISSRKNWRATLYKTPEMDSMLRVVVA